MLLDNKKIGYIMFNIYCKFFSKTDTRCMNIVRAMGVCVVQPYYFSVSAILYISLSVVSQPMHGSVIDCPYMCWPILCRPSTI